MSEKYCAPGVLTNLGQVIRRESRRERARNVFKQAIEDSRVQWIEDLKIQAEHKSLPEFLSLSRIGVLSGYEPDAFVEFIQKTSLKITEVDVSEPFPGKMKGATKSDYKAYLQSKGLWPANGLLANWWANDEVSSNKTPKYSVRAADCDAWLIATGVNVVALTDAEIQHQLSLWSKNTKIWEFASFRREFWGKYAKERGIEKPRGRRTNKI